MQSTSTELLATLKSKERELTELEGKLSFGQRFKRRYLTGRTLVAMKIASYLGAAKALAVVYLAAGKGIFPMVAVQHPVATKVVVTIWSKVVFVAVGAATLVAEFYS